MVRKGFTLIELSLAIVFVSILSITMALMITDAVRSYRRGMVLNQINTVGMELTDDIRTAVQNSPSQSITDECTTLYGGKNASSMNRCVNNKAEKLVTFVNRANVTLNGRSIGNVPVSGAVCFGNYTYMWNSGYFFSDEADLDENLRVSLSYKMSDDSSGEESGFRLLKVSDRSREVCQIAAGVSRGNYNGNNSVNVWDFRLSEALDEKPVDLLSRENENNSLALYDLAVATPAENVVGNAIFYSVSFILGTIQGGMNVMASGNFCSSPDEYDSVLDYCAINKFNFAAQAAGE